MDKRLLGNKLPILISKLFYKLFILIKDIFYFLACHFKLGLPFDKNFLNITLQKKVYRRENSILSKEDVINFFSLNALRLDWSEESLKTFKTNLRDSSNITSVSDKTLIHIFNILGSGDVCVKYGLKAQGFEGYKYLNQPDVIRVQALMKKIRGNIALFLPEQGNDLQKDDSITNQEYFLNYNYEPIDWHIDFKTGYRWKENLWYKKIRYGVAKGADIKIPWELSRCNHFLNLAQSYYLTKDEKYTREFIYEITDWIISNPVNYGVNWACTMDVAIRACNWIVAIYFFINSDFMNLKILNEILFNLKKHGEFILKNLERNPFFSSNNHYISNLTGLVYLGTIFKRTPYGRKWLQFGISELNREIKKQVYQDGFNFEASTSYHRLATELFFYPLYITTNNNDLAEAFTGDYISTVKKMFENILQIIKPDGAIPQIGDNDNGRLHIFSFNEILDCRYLLSIASVYFNDSRFKIREFGFSDDVLWLFGNNGFEKWKTYSMNTIDNINSTFLDKSGLCIMRQGKSYIIISAGENGQGGTGGHAHNDKLSYELCLQGKNINCDSGTYVYTASPEYRNKFRSTRNHNTAYIDNKEQNRFVVNNIFKIENDAEIKINKYFDNGVFKYFDAEHHGYRRLDGRVIHRRCFLYDTILDCIIIRDNIYGDNKHELDFNFKFHPGIEVIADKNKYILNFKNYDEVFFLSVLNNLEIESYIEKSFYSKSYGLKEETNKIRYNKSTILPFEITFLIVPEGSYNLEKINPLLDHFS